MSNSCLIRWIEHLLFGTTIAPLSVPPELRPLLVRLEVEHIPWSHIMLHGGLTAFPYQVHGDLNYLIEYLENQWLYQDAPYELRPLKSRAVAKFWDQLQLLLVKRHDAHGSALPTPPERDDEILKHLLEPGPGTVFSYQSAAFWGEVARRFIQLRRPDLLPAPLPPATSLHVQKLTKLYEMESIARGQYLDPWTLRLVHHREHVPAAHWQSPSNLVAFMRDRPLHSLTLSVQKLLQTSLEELLQGERPVALLQTCPRIEALLHNIRVIHESVEQVPQKETPPRLIDIFQRLLALCHRDELWEKRIPDRPSADPFLGTSLFYLTEQLRIAERERRVLWQHAREAFDGEPPQHTYSEASGANNKLCW